MVEGSWKQTGSLSLANGGLDYSTTGDKLAPGTISAIEAIRDSTINNQVDVPAVLPSGNRDTFSPELSADPRFDASDGRYDLVAGGNLLTAVGLPSGRPTRFVKDGLLSGFEVKSLNETSGLTHPNPVSTFPRRRLLNAATRRP